jgi:hypothetical protein
MTGIGSDLFDLFRGVSMNDGVQGTTHAPCPAILRTPLHSHAKTRLFARHFPENNLTGAPQKGSTMTAGNLDFSSDASPKFDLGMMRWSQMSKEQQITQQAHERALACLNTGGNMVGNTCFARQVQQPVVRR